MKPIQKVIIAAVFTPFDLTGSPAVSQESDAPAQKENLQRPELDVYEKFVPTPAPPSATEGEDLDDYFEPGDETELHRTGFANGVRYDRTTIYVWLSTGEWGMKSNVVVKRPCAPDTCPTENQK